MAAERSRFICQDGCAWKESDRLTHKKLAMSKKGKVTRTKDGYFNVCLCPACGKKLVKVEA
jgi:hypothetical protein